MVLFSFLSCVNTALVHPLSYAAMCLNDSKIRVQRITLPAEILLRYKRINSFLFFSIKNQNHLNLLFWYITYTSLLQSSFKFKHLLEKENALI